MIRLRDIKIKPKLSILFFLAALIPLAVITWITVNFTSDALMKEYYREWEAADQSLTARVEHSAVDTRAPGEALAGKWAIPAELNEKEAKRPIQTLVNKIILYGVFILLVILVLAYLVADSISKRLQKLAAFANAIAKGSLNTTLDINRKDEIGMLSHNLNKISGEFRKVFRRILIDSDSVNSSAEELFVISVCPQRVNDSDQEDYPCQYCSHCRGTGVC